MIQRVQTLLLVLALGALVPSQTPRGMVVAQNVVASQVGADILSRGGNAVDAAVATAFALAVVHPSAGNLGGGGFMIVRRPDGSVTSFDFREVAPAAATPDMFLDASGTYDPSLHHGSYTAVGVPGSVAGLWLAHKKCGRRPWRELVAPAIALARDGFPLTEELARQFRALKSAFSRHPSSLKVFYRADGSFYAPGDRFRQPDLARTLERIQKEGAAGFYRGRTAELIAAQMQRGGGLITREDLAAYRAVERTPLEGSYRGRTIVSMAPPSSGGATLIAMLNMLECFPIEKDPLRRIHLMTEVMRRGYAERARRLGDPDFNDPDMTAPFLDKNFARSLVNDLSMSKASVSRLEGLGWTQPEGENTTHFSVIDGDLGAVSMTYTLENSYGSRIVVDGAGFLLNDEMGDFNPSLGLTTRTGLIGTRPNLVAPGKRMLSSMTPTIVLDSNRRPVLLVGSPGGRTIINTVFEVVTNVIDLGLDVERAVDLGRFHHQWFPDRIRVEEKLARPEIVRGLQELGHRVDLVKSQGIAACIQVNYRRGGASFHAGVDPRYPDAGAAQAQ